MWVVSQRMPLLPRFAFLLGVFRKNLGSLLNCVSFFTEELMCFHLDTSLLSYSKNRYFLFLNMTCSEWAQQFILVRSIYLSFFLPELNDAKASNTFKDVAMDLISFSVLSLGCVWSSVWRSLLQNWGTAPNILLLGIFMPTTCSEWFFKFNLIWFLRSENHFSAMFHWFFCSQSVRYQSTAVNALGS